MPETGHDIELIESAGPRPFVTARHYRYLGQHHHWNSRGHRRGLVHSFRPYAQVWRPERLNAWIGWGFVIGASLFALGCILALVPSLPASLKLSGADVNSVFFVGSIFFTSAAYLQLLQAANCGAPAAQYRPDKKLWIGWKPKEIGWLSSFLQFIGTVLFNINTFMAIRAPGNWLFQDLTIWVPDVLGSILFLLSGYLAFIETCHTFWAWHIRRLSWWIVAVNLAGCVAFMVSAIYAFVPASGALDSMVHASVVWTLLGAVCFLAGAGLMLLEGRARHPKP